MVDQASSPHHEAVTHAMKGLEVELRDGLQRHESHRGASDRLSDRLGVDEVVLVRLDVRSNVLGREQSNSVALALETTRR